MAKKRKKSAIPGLSFSYKKALGITNAKRKIAKATGIPTTKSGRQRKIGKMVTGGGCCMYLIATLSIVTALIIMVI